MSEVFINLKMIGKRKFLLDVAETRAAMRGMSTTVDKTGKVMTSTTKRTWLMNQAFFTLRRLTYGLTLGFIAMGAIVLKWGFDFNKQINEAQVGFRGFIHGTQAINDELTKLYYLASITPFNFPEILRAARIMLPYQRNLQLLNQTVEALTNTLSASGTPTANYLNRAAIQFSHIQAMGVVRMQQINALARDQVPLLIMLAHWYGVSTSKMIDMIRTGLVPATAATQALIAYQKTQGYLGKNLAMATGTLTGAWATFQDVMRFAVGRGEKGIFEGIRKGLTEVVMKMLPLIKGNKPITIYMIAEAFDKALTPKTHSIIYLFNVLLGITQSIRYEFTLLFKIVGFVAGIFGVLSSKGDTGVKTFRAFGYVLGTAIFALIVYRLAVLAWIPIGALWWVWTRRQTIATAIQTAVQWLHNAAVSAYTALVISAALGTALFTGTLVALTVVVALLLVGLVVLYFKWKRFHDLVNDVGGWAQTHWYLLNFIPVFGQIAMAIALVVKNWERLNKLKNDLKHPFGGTNKSWWNKTPGENIRGWFASGGVANMAGRYMVGENGPEIVHLPRGASVQPVQGFAQGGAFALTIQPAPINIDGRKIGEVVFKHRLDRIARR